MCGIFGIYDSQNKINKSLFNQSLNTLSHRGPDNISSNFINQNLAFGHTRLSIIDLDKKNNQPFILNNYVLTFNGEIFNYLELRKELIDLGYSFTTSGDTEVLLNAYIEWGSDCVKKFNGMWAFSIYDKIKNIIFCSRDRYGIKPFYYYSDENSFIFSSEIKSIITYFNNLKIPNEQVIYNFLYNNYGNEGELTWFSNIKRLLPSTNLKFNFSSVKKTKYWDYSYSKNNNTLSFKKLLSNSVKLRLRSDVEIAATLSSGLDSNVICSIISQYLESKFQTFTAFSDNNNFTRNEKKFYSKNVDLDESLIVKNNENLYKIHPNYIQVSFDNFYKDLKKSIYHLESGHSSYAIVSALNIYKNVKRKNIKVILEGQGADELLGGYITETFFLTSIQYLKKLKFIKLFLYQKNLLKTYSLKEIIKIFINSFSHLSFFHKLKKFLMNNDITKKSFGLINKNNYKKDYFIKKHSNGLVNLLAYGDKLSMAYGIETRLPFLDYRLVNHSFNLDYEDKVNGIFGKHILRESFRSQIPTEVYESTLKLGFSTPIHKILTSDINIINKLKCKSTLSFICNYKKEILVNKFYNNEFRYSDFIFKILTILIWEETYLTNKH